MRAVLANFGTMGDILPFLALGTELAEHGHEVLLVLPPFATGMAGKRDLPCVALGPNLMHLQNQVNLGLSSPDNYEGCADILDLLGSFRPYFLPIFQQLKSACETRDVLICGPALPLGRIVHEMTGIPFVSVQLSNFGGSGGPALQHAGMSLLNPFRESLGLARIDNPLTTGCNSPQLTIYAMSHYLRPKSAEWPSHYHITGFFFDREEEYRADPCLSEFIRAGSAPVVVTFGSMVHHEPKSFWKIILDAIHSVGCRAIVQDIADMETKSMSIYSVHFVPHSWLMPQACCVVLHGGSGTAAAVFRAGIPGIFVPHGACYDQHYWGQLAEESGCSVRPIPLSGLSVAALGKAIEGSIHTISVRAKADALGRKIRTENGVQKARRLIEEVVRKTGLVDSALNL